MVVFEKKNANLLKISNLEGDYLPELAIVSR
jgi:hypothetical protein